MNVKRVWQPCPVNCKKAKNFLYSEIKNNCTDKAVQIFCEAYFHGSVCMWCWSVPDGSLRIDVTLYSYVHTYTHTQIYIHVTMICAFISLEAIHLETILAVLWRREAYWWQQTAQRVSAGNIFGCLYISLCFWGKVLLCYSIMLSWLGTYWLATFRSIMTQLWNMEAFHIFFM